MALCPSGNVALKRRLERAELEAMALADASK